MDEGLGERRLDGNVVYDGKIVRLEVDRVELANGHRTVREVIRHPGAVVVLPMHTDGRVVLVRQYRYPTGRVLLELPAGKLDAGEKPLDCARRELAEETGYRAVSWQALGSFFTTPGFTDEVLHAFAAQDLGPAQDASPEPDEVLRLVELPLAEVERRAHTGELADAKSLATLLLWRLHQV